MARIDINDLPENQHIDKEYCKRIMGGIVVVSKDYQQTDTSIYENFDQKSNQLFNILSTVLKSTKEAENSVTQNLL